MKMLCRKVIQENKQGGICAWKCLLLLHFTRRSIMRKATIAIVLMYCNHHMHLVIVGTILCSTENSTFNTTIKITRTKKGGLTRKGYVRHKYQKGMNLIVQVGKTSITIISKELYL